MKIISYNVNGIRAALRKDFISWLTAANPDVICIQETKANKDKRIASVPLPTPSAYLVLVINLNFSSKSFTD